MFKSATWLLSAAYLLVIAVFILIVRDPSHNLHPAEAYKDNVILAAVGVATALFVVAVFLERSLAVMNSLLFGDEQRAAHLAARSAKPALAVAGQAQVAETMSKKERLRLLVGFIAGLLISAGGIRTLGGLVAAPNPADWLFEPMDVLLTAGLLAGGSNGLAYLIQVFSDRLADRAPSEQSQVNALVVTT
jgi:hypothetical protein